MSTEPDAPNAAQARAWNGRSGAYWVDHAQRYDDGVAEYRPAYLAAAAVEPASRVLDVGCGNGQDTLDLARRATAGSALGVDLSAPMLDLARRRAETDGVTNASFRQADAQTHPFEAAAFDLVVSRHGAIFFDDPVAAFANLAGALRPGGRLVLLTWGPIERQEWLGSFFRALRSTPPGADGPGPLSLSDPANVRALLGRAGFADVEVTGLERPMWFGPDALDASTFIAGQYAGLLDALEPDVREHALADLRATMAAHAGPDGVRFGSACWLVTATR